MNPAQTSPQCSPLPPGVACAATDRLWVVSTLFNPAGYKSLTNNYYRFAHQLRTHGVNLLTVELTYPGQQPTLTGPNILCLQASDVMWHKERLLNLAIARLPASCDMVAWIDADILFNNHNWVQDTVTALQQAPVAQLFEKAILLDPQGNYYRDAYGFAFSHCSGFLDNPGGDRYQYLNGNTRHTGFAWAARRDIIAAWGGLYDYHILGGGDFQMALAVVGEQPQSWYGRFGPTFQRHMLQWANRCRRITGGKLGYVPGSILHLWHGHSEDRRYVERSRCLVTGEFDPAADLAMDDNGLWRWATAKPEMHQQVRSYFDGRNDDRDYPVHPTRHEDKYPLLLNCDGGPAAVQRVLQQLAQQGRTDFCVFACCSDWTQLSKIKPVLRDRPWPFEIRAKGSYPLPHKQVPRRFQLLKTLSDNSSPRCLFADKDTVIDSQFVSRVTRAGRVVVDQRGRLLGADRTLLLARELQQPQAEGESRLVAYATSRGIAVTTL